MIEIGQLEENYFVLICDCGHILKESVDREGLEEIVGTCVRCPYCGGKSCE